MTKRIFRPTVLTSRRFTLTAPLHGSGDIKVYESENVKYIKLVDYVYTRNGGTKQKVTKGSNQTQGGVFCIGAMARLGSSESRPTGDNRLLLIKKKVATHLVCGQSNYINNATYC